MSEILLAPARLFTTAEAAKLLSTSKDRILDWIRCGDLTAVNIKAPGSVRATWRIPEDALAKFLAVRATQPPTPTVKKAKRIKNARRFY